MITVIVLWVIGALYTIGAMWDAIIDDASTGILYAVAGGFLLTIFCIAFWPFVLGRLYS